jgi:ABC-type sugar transport system substrate-binding protein
VGRDDELASLLTRRQLLKSAGGAAAFAALFPLIEACGGSTGGGAAKKLAFGHPHPSGAFYAVVEAGVKSEAKKLGYELLQSRANGDLAAQITEIQTWIAEGVAAMTILALDVNSMAPLLKKAHDAGIPFVSYAQVVPGSDGFVLFDDAGAGQVVGQKVAAWINTKLGGKAKVAIMGDYTIQNGIPRMTGAQNAMMAACPGANVVFTGKGLLAPEAQATTQSLLVKHPDLKVVICHADDGALGAAQAFTNAGVDITNVYIAGYDGSLPAMTKAISGTSPLRLVASLPLFEIGRNSAAVPDNVLKHNPATAYSAPYTYVDIENKAAGQALIDAFNAAVAGG